MGQEMTYKRTVPTVYAVLLPGEIVKVGVSRVQRWRNFVARGAIVLELCEFPDDRAGAKAAFRVESKLKAMLSEIYPYGFASAEEARPALGIGGGGWSECFDVSSSDGPDGLAISQPYSQAIADLMARVLMARYGTVRNGTERHQDPGMNCPVPYAAGPVDKGSKR